MDWRKRQTTVFSPQPLWADRRERRGPNFERLPGNVQGFLDKENVVAE